MNYRQDKYRKNTSLHAIVELLKIKDREKILKAVEKSPVLYLGTKMMLTANFSSGRETPRIQRNGIL